MRGLLEGSDVPVVEVRGYVVASEIHERTRRGRGAGCRGGGGRR